MFGVDDLPTVQQAVFSLIGFYLLKRLLPKILALRKIGGINVVYKPDWQKDMVYLYQFPRSPVILNLSPYCLKVETWLRANKIQYQVIGSWTMRSKNGLLPFVELNGQQIADSQLIISNLCKHFKITESLSDKDKGIARAVDRMLDGSLYYALACFKVVEHGREFLSPAVTGLPLPEFITALAAIWFKGQRVKRLRAQGILKHDKQDILVITRRDLSAISAILGDKDYLTGRTVNEVDCSIFGHLASCYYLPFDQPIKRMLVEEFPTVRDFMERVKENVFPNWNELIAGK